MTNYLEEEKEFKRVDLKVITGGKGPSDDGNNWLAELPAGAQFLFRPRQRSGATDFGVQRAGIVHHYKDTTLLYDNLNQELQFIVVDRDFSTSMRCVEVIFLPSTEQEQTNADIAANESEK